MSRQIIVKTLSGFHLGMQVTVTTANTTATGILQGFRHDATALNAGNLMRDEWVTGRRETTITLLPNQEIIANMGDKVIVHGHDAPEPATNRNAAHQEEMNGETPAPGLPTGPRTVEVLHGPLLFDDYSRGYVKYGQAITGWPILKATVTEAPRNDTEREWLETYLPQWITPYGEIILGYEEGEGSTLTEQGEAD